MVLSALVWCVQFSARASPGSAPTGIVLASPLAAFEGDAPIADSADWLTRRVPILQRAFLSRIYGAVPGAAARSHTRRRLKRHSLRAVTPGSYCFDMGSILLSILAVGCLIAGPIIAARRFASRAIVQGNLNAGQSGVSPLFWGLALGLLSWLFALSLFIIADPIGGPLLVRLQLGALVFLSLGALTAPMIVCGFHKWRWDAEGLEFVGAFRRTKVAWRDIVEIRPTLDRGQLFLTAAGPKVRTSEYTVGVRLIAAALAHYRPDLAPTSA